MLPVVRKNNQYWMPSILNDFFGEDLMGFTPTKQFASPAVNILENEKNYQIEVAAPGMTKEDLKVNLNSDNELVIAFEKKDEHKGEKKNYLRREFSYSSFRQSFVLPDEVKAEAIDAEMTNGVLRISLPKKEAEAALPASRQIDIR